MSVWERVDATGQAHALTATQDKAARQKFSHLYGVTKNRADWTGTGDDLDEDPDHLVIGARRGDDTGIRLIGRASELHGPTGVCTCCPRRVGVDRAAS